jgi:hypothetical protein
MKTTIILPEELEEQIKLILNKKMKSFSSLIRDLLVSYVEENRSILGNTYQEDGFSDKQKEELKGMIKELLGNKSVKQIENKTNKEIVTHIEQKPIHNKEDLEPGIRLSLGNDRKETDSKEGKEKYEAAQREWNSLTVVKRSYPNLFDAKRSSYLESILNEWENKHEKK